MKKTQVPVTLVARRGVPVQIPSNLPLTYQIEASDPAGDPFPRIDPTTPVGIFLRQPLESISPGAPADQPVILTMRPDELEQRRELARWANHPDLVERGQPLRIYVVEDHPGDHHP